MVANTSGDLEGDGAVPFSVRGQKQPGALLLGLIRPRDVEVFRQPRATTRVANTLDGNRGGAGVRARWALAWQRNSSGARVCRLHLSSSAGLSARNRATRRCVFSPGAC